MRGTTYKLNGGKFVEVISTHVPHAGHDCICWVSSLLKFNIL